MKIYNCLQSVEIIFGVFIIHKRIISFHILQNIKEVIGTDVFHFISQFKGKHGFRNRFGTCVYETKKENKNVLL